MKKKTLRQRQKQLNQSLSPLQSSHRPFDGAQGSKNYFLSSWYDWEEKCCAAGEG